LYICTALAKLRRFELFSSSILSIFYKSQLYFQILFLLKKRIPTASSCNYKQTQINEKKRQGIRKDVVQLFDTVSSALQHVGTLIIKLREELDTCLKQQTHT